MGLRNIRSLGSAEVALVVSFLMITSSFAQSSYSKVEVPWYQQGKISGGISVSNTSAATLLPTAGQIAWVCNTGSNDAYIAFGSSAVTATSTGSSWLKASACASYDLYPFRSAPAYLAAITGSSTTNLTVETGIGSGPQQTSSGGGGGGSVTQGTSPWIESQVAGSPGTFSGSVTNPPSSITLPSSTTAYTAGQLIANNATAGSITNSSFSILNSAGGAAIPRVRLSTNDSTTTAWSGQTIQVDLWSASPTWSNGDRAAWLPATGVASHLATYSCQMSIECGDGAFAECGITVGNFTSVKLVSGTSIYWSLEAITGSGVTGAGKVFTVVPELIN